MKAFLWIGGALLLLVAAGAVWWNVSDPVWVAGLIAAASGAAWKALTAVINAQIARDLTSPEVDARNKAEARLGGPPPRTGVTTSKTITKPALVKRTGDR